ncbi:short-chain dehydrogenase/reductase SDR [Clostridium sp. CAG:557]|jgi:hypothetical protein|nr:short-chain dehydrogenase/reductase SDR [Clostridium sp. CAG:557]
MKTVLVLGVGQIGKAITKRIIEQNPERIILHNLTKTESGYCCKYFSEYCKNIELIPSYGDVFLPFDFNKLNTMEEQLKYKDELLSFYYSDLGPEILKKSTLYKLVQKWNPDLIIDAINSGTVLGNHYKPELILSKVSKSANIDVNTSAEILLNDFVPKAVNFVYSLKLVMEDFKVKKYLKVSTTGLGGMGMNMPYTHGDTPKSSLSFALMGKISAAGVLHQLLWNLSHTTHHNISLLIPATFVGYDSTKFEPIETDVGLVKKINNPQKMKLVDGEKLTYSKGISDEYLEFPVVRAGENHVYSLYELSALTALGQMEAITKEEVANAAIEDICGKTKKNMLNYMDSGMLGSTFAGKAMVEKIKSEIQNLMKKNNSTSIATGNLGVTVAKRLYELYMIKQVCKTVDELKSIDIKKLYDLIIRNLENNRNLLVEMLSLGLPIVTENDNIYIGEYSLYPDKGCDLTITRERLEKWIQVGWVDLRVENILFWKETINFVYNDARKVLEDKNFILNRDAFSIDNDYDIGEILAYYYNLQEKGRKTCNI